MEEKRKNKRLDLDVNVQLERLDEDGVTTLKFVHVDVTDISKSGIGFDCKRKLIPIMMQRSRYGQKKWWMQSSRLSAAKKSRTDFIMAVCLSE